MELKTFEKKAIKTEIDTRIEEKESASSVGLCQRHKPQHPHRVKMSPRGLPSR